MTFGERLKELRLEKNLSQSDFGALFNKSANNISQYETGKRQPDLETLQQMSSFFNVSVDYLLGNTDTKRVLNHDSQSIIQKNDNNLSEKNKKDIAKKMRKLREEIANEDGLMLDGEILTEETKDLLLQLLEKDEIAATLNNKKYIPKKYRK